MQKRMHLRTGCGYFTFNILFKMLLIILERLNLAVNAAIAEQAAAARLVLASQALSECRQQNNPYQPGSSFGPSRQQMYGPDPCLEQEKELAEARAAKAAAQISNAPTSQNTGAQPAVQLANTWDSSELYQPETMNVDLPELESQWSPDSVDRVMQDIIQRLGDVIEAEEVAMELETLEENMIAVSLWVPLPMKQTKFRYQLKLRDPGWVRSWVPKR